MRSFVGTFAGLCWSSAHFGRVIKNVLSGPSKATLITNNPIVVAALPDGLTRSATQGPDSLTSRRLEAPTLAPNDPGAHPPVRSGEAPPELDELA